MKSLMFNKQKLPIVVQRQDGVTLIEALVTLLVLSVGALGIASMQLAGLKYASGSYGRTQAVILADDMANRLKSNRQQALGAAAYNLPGFGSPTPAIPTDCLNIICTPADLAAYDLATWPTELARVLPSGQGSITSATTTVPGLDGTTITQQEFSIVVGWRQVSSGTSNTSSTESVNFDPDSELQSFTFRILL